MIRFISFEGGDGSGKTTQLGMLERYLTDKGMRCVCTREPGGTALGRMIREALVEVGQETVSSPTELFLYLADRAHHVREVIEPALKDGKTVLCDRFADSTVAYQGYGRGIDLALLRRLNEIASGGVMPGLTLLLDCPVEIGLSRAQRQRFEQERAEFHERVRCGFLELAKAEPERVVVIDASLPVLAVHAAIKEIVDGRLAVQDNAK